MSSLEKLIIAAMDEPVLKTSIKFMVCNLTQKYLGDPPEELVEREMRWFVGRAIEMALSAEDDCLLDVSASDFRAKLFQSSQAAIHKGDWENLIAECHARITADWPDFCIDIDGLFSYSMLKLAYTSSSTIFCLLCNVDSMELHTLTDEESASYKTWIRKIAEMSGATIIEVAVDDN
ncbi:MAG: hypothetical protein V1738_07020 [Patescibacteria group bacterium]